MAHAQGTLNPCSVPVCLFSIISLGKTGTLSIQRRRPLLHHPVFFCFASISELFKNMSLSSFVILGNLLN